MRRPPGVPGKPSPVSETLRRRSPGTAELNAEDPAYAEEMDPYGVPDPPCKPFPPPYVPLRHQSSRQHLRFVAGDGAHDLAGHTASARTALMHDQKPGMDRIDLVIHDAEKSFH